MSATTTTGTMTNSVSTRQIWGSALLGGVIGAVINLVIWLIGQQALGSEFLLPAGPGGEIIVLSAIPIVIASIIPALGAAGLLSILNRFTSRAWTIFLVIAGVFLVLSFAPVISLPVDGIIQVSLGLMHVVSGVTIVGALWRNWARAT